MHVPLWYRNVVIRAWLLCHLLYFQRHRVFAGNSKSVGGNSMGVQLPLPAPSKFRLIHFIVVNYGSLDCTAE
jgi:hypothetical protein